MVDGSDILYRGEQSRRSTLAAVLLNLPMPGLGDVYCGRLRGGLLLYGLFFAITVGYFVAAWHLGVFLGRAVLVYASAWAYLQVVLLLRTRRRVRRHGQGYVLHPFNHPLVYGGLLLALGAMPWWLLHRYALRHVLDSHRVEDTNAFPQLLPGDRVYLDRTAFDGGRIRPGDLVVLQPDGRPPTVVRVVATAGDRVGVHGDVLVVDGVPRPRRSLGNVELAPDLQATVAGGRWVAHVEQTPDRHYVVFDRVGAEGQDIDATFVPDGHVFVLSDNRNASTGVDSRVLGPSPIRSVRGRPLWVWWSVDPSSERIRWWRIGLAVH